GHQGDGLFVVLVIEQEVVLAARHRPFLERHLEVREDLFQLLGGELAGCLGVLAAAGDERRGGHQGEDQTEDAGSRVHACFLTLKDCRLARWVIVSARSKSVLQRMGGRIPKSGRPEGKEPTGRQKKRPRMNTDETRKNTDKDKSESARAATVADPLTLLCLILSSSVFHPCSIRVHPWPLFRLLILLRRRRQPFL